MDNFYIKLTMLLKCVSQWLHGCGNLPYCLKLGPKHLFLCSTHTTKQNQQLYKTGVINLCFHIRSVQDVSPAVKFDGS